MALADLPSHRCAARQIARLFIAPATKLVTLINTPATQLAQVIKAKAEKAGKRPETISGLRSLQTGEQTNNNNVNRRFAGRELKFAEAAGGRRDDRKKVNNMADIANIVEELSKLTVIEAADLVKQLETKWGVSAAAPVAVAAAGGGRCWRCCSGRRSERHV